MRVSLKTFTGEEYRPVEERTPIECFRCGICCQGYYPQLSHQEVARMAGQMKISPDEFISRYVQVTTIGYLLRQTKNGCVFLAWENACPEPGRSGSPRALCTVHSFRPDACRAWEPTLFRRECREGLARIQKDGGIMLAGEVYEDPEQLERFCAALRKPN